MGSACATILLHMTINGKGDQTGCGQHRLIHSVHVAFNSAGIILLLFMLWMKQRSSVVRSSQLSQSIKARLLSCHKL